MKRERLRRLLRTRSLLHSFCYFLISFECVCVCGERRGGAGGAGGRCGGGVVYDRARQET